MDVRILVQKFDESFQASNIVSDYAGYLRHNEVLRSFELFLQKRQIPLNELDDSEDKGSEGQGAKVIPKHDSHRGDNGVVGSLLIIISEIPYGYRSGNQRLPNGIQKSVVP